MAGHRKPELYTVGSGQYHLRMPTNNIELELRAGLERKNIKPLAAGLERLGFRLGSSTRRTSIMHFGHVTRYDKYTSADDDHVDIRCRVTNGRAEVVAKIGPPHGHNRKARASLLMSNWK